MKWKKVRVHFPQENLALLEAKGAVGGGTYPGVELAGWALALDPPDGAEAYAARLRSGRPPVIVRIADGRVLLDPRTVDTEEEDSLVRRITEAWSGEAKA